MNAPQSPSLVILGGGVAGVAVAYYAQRLGVPCTLFEKNAWIGGLSRTFQAGEHFYDSGAHRFHDQYADTTADVRSLLGDELRQVRSPSKIYDRGNLIDFPPTPLNLLGSLSVREIGKACFDLVRARCTIQNPKSFEEFAIGRFGESLARRYLIRYTEKLWGLPADELSVDVATRRLSGMSFGTLVKEILAPSRKADHIDGEFLYPQHGIGRIVEAMAATLPPGSIRKEHEVAKIVCRKGRVNRILFTNGAEVAPGSRVISTLPVGRMASLLGDAISPESRRAALRLRFRSLRLVFLRLARPRVSHNATIYLPQRDTSVSRVHEPKNRSPWMAPSNETSLVAEVPCFQGEQQCSAPDEQLAELVIDELASAKLIDRTQVLEWRHHLLPDAYPVYTLGYEQNVRAVLEGLSIIDNLDPIGRGGRFQYSQMHHQLRWSKQYVENRPWR